MNFALRIALPLILLLSVRHPAPAQNSSFDRYDVSHYQLTIFVAPATRSFSGAVRVDYRTLAPTSVIPLFASHQTLQIDSVIGEKVSLAFCRARDTLFVELPSPSLAGTASSLTVYYRGRSDFRGNYDGGGIYFPDSVANGRFGSISEPSFGRTWWPSKDMPSDKATATVIVTVPKGLTVASNGLLTSVADHESTSTFEWETSYPIATYLVSLAAAPYSLFGEEYPLGHGRTMPISYYVYPADLEKAKRDFLHTKEFLAFLEARFGEYPFAKEKFGYAEVDGDLTMEHQTLCSISAAILDGKRTNELTYLHEMAHQWFGNLITPASWYDSWLNEGFATYCEHLYAESIHGRARLEDFASRMNATAPGLFADAVIGKSDTAFWDAFNSSVYFKGAMVLHMLRGMTGDSIFFATLKAYCADPALRYANATTDDFIRHCERAYGKPLRWFFDEWLRAMPDSVDRPIYGYSWRWDSSSGSAPLTLRINQRQSARALYTMPIPVSAFVRGTEERFVVRDSLGTQTFSLPVSAPPDSVVIDPHQWLFRSVTKENASQ